MGGGGGEMGGHGGPDVLKTRLPLCANCCVQKSKLF